MDDKSLDEASLSGALRGLRRINFLSASAHTLWRPLVEFAHRTGKQRLRVLDIATGAGDLPIALWQKSQRAGLPLELHGIDFNHKSVAFAREQAERAGAKVQFSQLDALDDQLPGDQDVVISSLFLHHLDEAAVIRLLGKMAETTNHLVLINDLRRHCWGLVLAHFAGHVLSRSPVVRVDAVRSVRAAFTLPEIKSLSAAAGLNDARFCRRWPCHYLMVWEKANHTPSNE
jgi:2-polyprenyl-3-methyl-5-hydroxy-6-metoxy-1,4-benzoquinol methylase